MTGRVSESSRHPVPQSFQLLYESCLIPLPLECSRVSSKRKKTDKTTRSRQRGVRGPFFFFFTRMHNILWYQWKGENGNNGTCNDATSAAGAEGNSWCHEHCSVGEHTTTKPSHERLSLYGGTRVTHDAHSRGAKYNKNYCVMQQSALQGSQKL